MARRRKRSKSVSLDKSFWLRNSAEIQLYREAKLKQQKGVCAVSGVQLEVGTLDHTHQGGCGAEGGVRGVLLSEVNTLEGKYLKLFKRMKLDTKYDLTFPEFLIALGEYLQQDNTSTPLHFKYMDDFRKSVKRWRKDTLIKKLYEDFGIEASSSDLVRDLVQLYVQSWVDFIECEIKQNKS